MSCENKLITYMPLYLNLCLSLFAYYLTHVRHKHTIKKINKVEKSITSTKDINEQRYSKDIESNLKKILSILVLSEESKSIINIEEENKI